MSYTFVQDVPADAAIYDEIRTAIGDEAPEGLVCHLAIEREGGLRYVDVWDTKDQFDHFRETRVEPAVAGVLASHGIPQDPTLLSFDEVELVHAWIPDR